MSDSDATLLLEALKCFMEAQQMSTVPDYSKLPDLPNIVFHKEFGGGDCEVHGRFYGGRCLSCMRDREEALTSLKKEARQKRDIELRKAFENASKLLRKLEGGSE